jgi:hypothetical protein
MQERRSLSKGRSRASIEMEAVERANERLRHRREAEEGEYIQPRRGATQELREEPGRAGGSASVPKLPCSD